MESRKKLIVILASQIQHTPTGWVIEEGDGPGDTVGPTYGAFRVAAGAYVAEEYPEADLVASGFTPSPDGPSIASVVKEQLIRFGVAPARIMLLDTPRNTYHELKELSVLMARGYEEALIVTNEWHAPRVEAMVAYVPVPRARVLPAEEVLLRHDAALWVSRVARMRADPRIAKRIALEKKGVEDINAGRYTWRQG